MLVGAAVYAELHSTMTDSVLTWGNLGKLTLPDVLGVSPLVVVPVLAAAYLGVLVFFEKKGL